MGCLIVASLNSEGGGVDADLDGCGPVGVHLSVLVMIALKLQLQIRSVGHVVELMCYWNSLQCCYFPLINKNGDQKLN